ncbi:hypothetical protein OAM67_01595, partial [bacterium]|nr:hypothetical protein [bacterium]
HGYSQGSGSCGPFQNCNADTILDAQYRDASYVRCITDGSRPGACGISPFFSHNHDPTNSLRKGADVEQKQDAADDDASKNLHYHNHLHHHYAQSGAYGHAHAPPIVQQRRGRVVFCMLKDLRPSDMARVIEQALGSSRWTKPISMLVEAHQISGSEFAANLATQHDCMSLISGVSKNPADVQSAANMLWSLRADIGRAALQYKSLQATQHLNTFASPHLQHAAYRSGPAFLSLLATQTPKQKKKEEKEGKGKEEKGEKQ